MGRPDDEEKQATLMVPNVSPTLPEPELAPVLISALEHFSYCQRQCALIHVEQVFEENLYTLRGRHSHERADTAITRMEKCIRIERALPLFSDRLGLLGKADVVEFHADGKIVPVEYKHGARRISRHDDLQLCAQALCLEEMFRQRVTVGAIYSLKSKRRREVEFHEELREETIDAIGDVRALLQQTGPLPPAHNDQRCRRCSLIDACVPATLLAASVAGKDLFRFTESLSQGVQA